MKSLQKAANAKKGDKSDFFRLGACLQYLKFSFQLVIHRAKICEKCQKRVTWMGGYGCHTQVKFVFKALISGTCKNNIITYSQMRFQLQQLHSLTATGLKNGKKSKYWVSVGILETSM